MDIILWVRRGDSGGEQHVYSRGLSVELVEAIEDKAENHYRIKFLLGNGTHEDNWKKSKVLKIEIIP